jgi:hypothetical protein
LRSSPLTAADDGQSRGSNSRQASKPARQVLGDGAETQGPALQGEPPDCISGRHSPPGRFILLGLIAAFAIVAFRVQSLVTEREHVLQQRRAQAATLAQFAATYVKTADRETGARAALQACARLRLRENISCRVSGGTGFISLD